MSVIRAFIAINLSPEIYKRLDQVCGDLKERLPGAPVRWVSAHNIHLTIKFLGNVSVSSLEILKRILFAEVGRHTSFEISVGELGAFPSISRPRVVWVGIEAPAELDALQRGVETEMARLGYSREKRAFSPHLTLGRVSRNADSREIHRISDVVGNYKLGFLGATRIQEVHLYRSDLQPGGAVYTRLDSAALVSNEP
jgi:2'-5' RNA ligase